MLMLTALPNECVRTLRKLRVGGAEKYEERRGEAIKVMEGGQTDAKSLSRGSPPAASLTLRTTVFVPA